MAVPSGDQRDFDFARYFNIQIINIFDGIDISRGPFEGKESIKLKNSSFLKQSLKTNFE